MPAPRTIVLCAGELSGDMHASHVVTHLAATLPGACVVGMAGDHCRRSGMDVRFEHRDYAVIGFTGVVAGLPRFLRLERALRALIDHASLFIAVDYPGLNLRLCRYARSRGVPVLYYIAPQVWAWGEGRVAGMRRTIDRLAVVLPFEVPFYRERGLAAEFVGHPFVVDHELPVPDPAAPREGVALLPGSREAEVRRMLPVFVGAARDLSDRRPGLRFAVAMSPVVARDVYERALAGSGLRVTLEDDAVRVLLGARAAMVTSGTATLQSALLETPLVVVYRTSPLNYAIARRVVRIANVGLVNILLGETVAPELVQHAATPAAIASAIDARLDDGPARRADVDRFRALRRDLAGGRGAARVAEMATELWPA